MNRTKQNSRNGFTLLEMAVSVAMLAAMTTSSVVLVRTTYTAWNRHEDDHAQMRAGVAVLRHIVRQTRQATAVSAISIATDNSGSLSLVASNNNTQVWDHNSSTNEMRYGITSATELLAKNIDEFTVVGIKANGTDITTDVDLIHSIRCTVKYTLIRPAGKQQQTVSCQAWLRSW